MNQTKLLAAQAAQGSVGDVVARADADRLNLELAPRRRRRRLGAGCCGRGDIRPPESGRKPCSSLFVSCILRRMAHSPPMTHGIPKNLLAVVRH